MVWCDVVWCQSKQMLSASLMLMLRFWLGCVCSLVRIQLVSWSSVRLGGGGVGMVVVVGSGVCCGGGIVGGWGGGGGV